MDGYNSTSSAPAEMFLQYVLLWELTYPFPKTLLSAENIHQTKITQTTTITLLPTRPPKKTHRSHSFPLPPKAKHESRLPEWEWLELLRLTPPLRSWRRRLGGCVRTGPFLLGEDHAHEILRM